MERSLIRLRPYGPWRLRTYSEDELSANNSEGQLQASSDDNAWDVMGHRRRNLISQEMSGWRGLPRAGRRNASMPGFPSEGILPEHDSVQPRAA